MVRRITQEQAKREIHLLALKIWAGVSVGLLTTAYVVTRVADIFLTRYTAQEFQGAMVPPLILGVLFFVPFAITTAYKRWIWSDASTIWKNPAAAISHIRENSPLEKRAQSEWRPRYYGWRNADKSVRILPDYIQARTIACEEAMVGGVIDNGPRGSIENSMIERPLRWYEMFVIPALVILVPAAIFGFCYVFSTFGWNVCWS